MGDDGPKRVDFLLLAANQRCLFYFACQFIVPTAISPAQAPCQKTDTAKELCRDRAWKIAAAKAGGLSSHGHVNPEGHNGSPDRSGHAGQREQQQQQQHPRRSRAAASCSLQLPPARLVLPVLGLPGCLSHTCSAHPSESCQRKEQTKDEHTAVSRWKLHATQCWVLCRAPTAA